MYHCVQVLKKCYDMSPLFPQCAYCKWEENDKSKGRSEEEAKPNRKKNAREQNLS